MYLRITRAVFDPTIYAQIAPLFSRAALGTVIDRLGALGVQLVEPEIYELEDAGAAG